jgi:hypothetical protein
MQGCELTGGLTHKDRYGTIIDWNLCFNANGASSNRSFRSGTPAFMALALFDGKKISQRTLGHDMESFFAVIIWMATLNHVDEAAFQDKPLASMMIDRKETSKDIVNAKDSWFRNLENFQTSVLNHFEPAYLGDMKFLACLLKLRRALYPMPDLSDDSVLNSYTDGGLDKNDNKKTEDADPMKEGLFRTCMEEMDNYFDDHKGCDEMDLIDKMDWNGSKSPAPHTPASLR